MPKFGSKKVRTGCTQCKIRRVKCDEAKPSCKNCEKHGQECVYQAPPPRKTAQKKVLTPLSLESENSTPVPEDEPLFSLLDMALLHHYTLETYFTIARPQVIELWRTEVPKMAYEHLYLMQGIIALSALHRASKEPKMYKVCMEKAITCVTSGLPKLRELVSNLANENPSAIVAFAGIVSLFGTALAAVQYSDTQGPEDPVSILLDSFALFRGTKEIITSTFERITEGPMRALIAVDPLRVEIPKDPYVLQPRVLGETLERIIRMERMFEEDLSHDKDLLKDYKYAHLRLSQVVCVEAKSLGQEWYSPTVFAWPAVMPATISQELRENKPPAIAMLAYWVLFVYNSRWSTKGWRSWVANDLGNRIYPERWRELINWPLMKIQRHEVPW